MLEVSRTTVRQALGRLAALGVTESRRGRNGGTFTVDWHPSAEAVEAVSRTLEPIRRELEALFDFRSLVEQTVARTAALRHTTSRRQGDARPRLPSTAAPALQRSHARRTVRLHAAVAAAGRNPHLTSACARAWSVR